MARKPININAKNAEKYDYAYMLYMQKVPQKDICERVGISNVTLGKWKDSGSWEEKRAANNISIDELIGKTLKKINELLDSDNFNADAFSKAVNQLKTLKGSDTVNDVINVFTAFSMWIMDRHKYVTISKRIDDKDDHQKLDAMFIKKITYWQDQYVQYRLSNKDDK